MCEWILNSSSHRIFSFAGTGLGDFRPFGRSCVTNLSYLCFEMIANYPDIGLASEHRAPRRKKVAERGDTVVQQKRLRVARNKLIMQILHIIVAGTLAASESPSYEH